MLLSLMLSDGTYDRFLFGSVQRLPPDLLRFLNEKFLFPIRRWHLTRILSPYIKSCSSVLDLGASDGRLAAQIVTHLRSCSPDIEFTGCDVKIQPTTHIPIVEYDGRHIPFADNSFDCVMLIDVLHHSEDPFQVLTEARRVSRRIVLAKDHYWISKKDFSRLKAVDYLGNMPFEIPLPFRFLTMDAWKDLLQHTGFAAITSHTFRYNLFDPCKHVVFRVEV